VTDGPVDPRIDKLIASLYGELSEEQERELQRLLAEDAALRAEWEELRSTRAILKGWEVEEAPPSFVIVGGEAGTVPSARAPIGRWDRLKARLERLAPSPAWGLAAAALLLAGLALADFQIQRVDGGIALRFGDRTEGPVVAKGKEGASPAAGSATPAGGDAGRAPSIQAIPASGVTGGQHDPKTLLAPGNQGSAPDGAAPYLTREEFKTYADGMARTIVALLNDYSDRRDEELSHALVNMYQELNQKQTFAYDDLSGKIDAVRVGLIMEKTKTDAQLETLLDQAKGEPLAPGTQPPTKKTEEK
jgi:hypothetical protein